MDTAAERRSRPLESRPVVSQEAEPKFLDADTFLARLLEEQHQLTAVEQFAQEHATCEVPQQARYYSRLLPATGPGPGQQYGFEVDLDRCSGCKACVTACHTLNGLDEQETWRDVGLLIGGTSTLPVLQHVTAACHHCLEPGCMIACPVDAYEKDPVTGIVKHLDDQCFGCQYCTLACPYNVPKYHAGKGIVRKCDLCSDRLKHGEAPACVQACPHEAIAIRLVDREQVRQDSEADNFLPAAPEPSLTFPTTIYKTNRVFPRNMLPADYLSISPQHPHWPLIIMLVLTQLSVGAFTVGCLMESSLPPALLSSMRPFHATASLVFGLLALAASTFHLGRPQYAFRAVIGLRHSWLSREIVGFGLFAGMAVLYAVTCWVAAFSMSPRAPALAASFTLWIPLLGWATVATGSVGVFCSVMIYVFTKREFWSLERTLLRFGLSACVLGTATSWALLFCFGWLVNPEAANGLQQALSRPLAGALIGFTIGKLTLELALLRHLGAPRMTPLKRSAKLSIGPLSNILFSRLALAALGGIASPLLLLQHIEQGSDSLRTPVVGILVSFSFLGCLVGELLERYQFFAAVSAPRMPGGLRP